MTVIHIVNGADKGLQNSIFVGVYLYKENKIEQKFVMKFQKYSGLDIKHCPVVRDECYWQDK